MNAYKFVKENGLEKAKVVVEGAPSGAICYWEIPRCDQGVYSLSEINKGRSIDVAELKQAISDFELIESCGGIEVAKKITFQKRMLKPKATHFIQHPNNKNLVQFFSKNENKPDKSIRFDVLESAIQKIEGVFDHHPLPSNPTHRTGA